MKSTTQELERFFAERLREEREKVRISQLDLALKAGIAQNLVNFIETGKRIPNLRTILRICIALNISPSVLFSTPDEEREKAKKTIVELIQRYL